ncbi:hybrid sensor histidine kinase/response regulator [Paenibacillus planticolens]|uniref:histidine kinase n=1 Tax=Paenibacillus planticolens TaxID=2654976 RepID=A0ABX1ZQ48_9BACL|nr:ATP-binding protein [Paenibacillus planticolens]NOV01012.1 response regulator [Paenibacillus planticolens]
MYKLRQLIALAVVFSLSVLLFIGIYAQSIPNKATQSAKHGVLDLTSWDFHRQGLVSLDGEWEFYEGKLLEPADFRAGPGPDAAYLAVPGTWKGKNKEGGMSRKGYATYRLKVLVHANGDDIYGVKLRSIRMSHRLYIDGQLQGESGRPAEVKEAHAPGNTPYSAFFHTDAKEIEVIIQVSNYEFFTGGIVNSIQFGGHKDIAQLDNILIGSDMVVIFILVMFGTYHISFYFLRRQEKTYLLSGLYLFSLSAVQLLFGEKIFQRLMPGIPFDIVYKALDVSQFVSSLLSILFFCSLDNRLIPRRKLLWLTSPIVMYVAVIFVLPYSLYNEVRYAFFVYIGLVPLYILTRMIHLYLRSQRGSSERKEILLFIAAIVSLLVFLIDGSLYAENAVASDLMSKVGVICFITLMNILLAVRFKNAYEKNELLTHQLMVSNQRKDEFLMHTSHEVKTPLHGIMNITSHLLDDDEHNLSSKQKQSLWLIKDTSIKLSMLMRDLIDVSRLKQGELRLHMTVVDVRTVTQIVFDVLQFELAGKAVRLDNQVPPNVWAEADENRLRQIMYNLIHNSIKHTNQGSIVITASVSKGIVSISVEDTGTGIPRDRHSEIFGYFEQLDQVLPDDGYTGMGVGLYISRKLVERMGGQIGVEWSEAGQGTRMTFSLPSADERAPLYEGTSDSDMNADSGRIVQSRDTLDILEEHESTILIVDDEASNIYTLLNILKRYRYNVVTAFSAKEALAKIKEYPQIDLVILDVMMPGISGIELCRLLRAHHSILDLPILFATAKDTPQDIALGFRAGANDYLTKPFEAETLLARIHTLIAMKTSIQEAILSELAFHQAQIKPHFLYNALSSVISFCYTDGEKAAYLLSKLSQYLRYILDMDRHELYVSLGRELELIDAYVEIEKARFGERFDVIYYVDDNLKDISIPSLCIQPFIENAIRHGLFEKDGHGTVTLSIQEGDRYLQVSVHDDGVGIPDDLLYRIASGRSSTGGIGISNIRKRLDAIPGATVTVSSELGRGTKVVMYLPFTSTEYAAMEERGAEIV